MENQVLDAIFNRRSIRRYTDQPVSSDQLDLILKAGQAAPSAMNQQPELYFVAIQRKDMIEQLASLLTENEDPYYNAPLLIVVFAR